MPRLPIPQNSSDNLRFDLNTLLTPPAVGGFAVTIAQSLAYYFNFGPPWNGILVLIIGLLFSSWVVWEAQMKIPKKVLYCLISALIIFVNGLGLNTLGRTITEPTTTKQEMGYDFRSPTNSYAHTHGKHPYVILAAQETSPMYLKQLAQQTGWCCVNRDVIPMSKEQCLKRGGKFSYSKEDARKSCKIFLKRLIRPQSNTQDK